MLDTGKMKPLSMIVGIMVNVNADIMASRRVFDIVETSIPMLMPVTV
jgi:hypothetical protein